MLPHRKALNSLYDHLNDSIQSHDRIHLIHVSKPSHLFHIDSNQQAKAWKQASIAVRVKSASNSRYGSPAHMQQTNVTVKPVPNVRKHRRAGSEIKPVKDSLPSNPTPSKKQTQSANGTPKHGESKDRLKPPSNLFPKKRAQETDLSMEVKLTESRKTANSVNISMGDINLLSREKNQVSQSYLRLEVSDGSEESMRREREELGQFISNFYKVKQVLPQTSSEFYQFRKIIGKGAFGKVSLALHKLTGLEVAVKSIDKMYMKEERTRLKVLQEVANMRKIQNLHVTRLFEVFESSRHFNMVLEYSAGGDLLRYMKARGRLPEPQAKPLFYQVAEAVRACHAQGVIHRDVKLDNVLLDAHFSVAKICDFGVSRTAIRGQHINDQCGTPAYIAPEIIADRGYDGFYVDLWSLGVFLYALVVGTVPFRATNMADLQKMILRGQYQIPNFLSPEVRDLIDGLLKLVPTERLSLDKILTHVWLSGSAGDGCSSLDTSMGRVNTSNKAKRTDKVNRDVLQKLEILGLPGDYISDCLHFNEINHGTATYELLLLNRV